MGISKNVKEFALIGFLLLAVLFGMNIMVFIFGNLSSSRINTFDDLNRMVSNQSGYALNGTLYTIPAATLRSFSGGFTVLLATNGTSGQLISPGNYTVNAAAGTIINSTATKYPVVNLTYTYNYKSDQEISAEDVNNNSLTGISTYSSNSSTQFTTLSVAIILVLLLAVFAVFWKAFQGDSGERKWSGGSE